MFPAHLVQEWSVKNVKALSEYTPGSRYRAWWICSEGHEWQTRIVDRCRIDRKPTNCPQCTRDSQGKLSDHPHLVAGWSNKNRKQIDNYSVGSHYRAWWICIQGHEWQSRIDDRTRLDGRATGCPQCAGRQPPGSKLSDYLHLAAEWSVKNEYPIDGYSRGSTYRAWWTCTQGHEWQTRISARTRKIDPSGCPRCSNHKRKYGYVIDNTVKIVNT